MDTGICFITGGNSGIGFEAARQLAQSGHTVILGCRNKDRGLDAEKRIRNSTNNDAVHFLELDMSLQASIRAAAKTVKERFDHIDVLIHNAADFDISRKEPLFTKEGIESVWATNHVGPVLLTRVLSELLEKSTQGRIITIASQGLMLYPKLKINHADPEFRNCPYSVEKAYYQSKLAQVMYTYWLSEKMKGAKTTINCIRVTNVKIDIRRYPNISGFMKWLYSIKSKFSIAPEKMAETYVYAATNPDLADTSGKYFDERNVPVQSSAYSHDEREVNRLMETTERFLIKES